MRWDSVWDRTFKTKEWGKYPGEDVIRFVAGNYYARERAKVTILEVGSGTGANIWYLAREGFDVYGVEGSVIGVERCRERLSAEGLIATLRVGDIADLSYQENMFDCVLDVGCLCCNSIDVAERVISRIAYILKPGGKFYSRGFAENMFIDKFAKQVGEMEYSAVYEGPLEGLGYVRLLNRQKIDRLYGACLQIESVERASYSRGNGSQVVSEWQITCVKLD